MNNFGFRRVLISVLFGSISSVILLYIELQDTLKYIDKTEFRFVILLLLQTFLFSIAFLYISLLFRYKKENPKEGNPSKSLEMLRRTFQILFVLLTVSIIYLPVISNFFFMFGILLLCIGASFYYQTKSKLAVSVIILGLAILVLTYFMICLTYGFENCI